MGVRRIGAEPTFEVGPLRRTLSGGGEEAWLGTRQVEGAAVSPEGRGWTRQSTLA